MDAFSQLLIGFAVALTPRNLLWCLVGTTLGTAIGVLPGLGPALTIALLLPITFKVDPTAAFILFAGIYYGAMYGGSTTSILLNTPGESATIITALEGNRMARNGRAGAALATAAIGSFVAGTIGTLGITFLAPIVVDLALKFGPADYFSLMVLAFVTVSAVLGSSMVRGLTALLFGIWLGLIGVDLQTGQPRFTFGLPELLDGINVVVVAVGLFAVGETLYVASRYRFGKDEIIPLRGSVWMTPEEWKRSWKPWLRGPVGAPIGAAGRRRRDPTFPSHYMERKLTPQAEEPGRGGSKASPGRRRPTTPRTPACWCRCSRSACRPRPLPRSCCPRFRATASIRGRCCSSRSRSWSGA
jgi:putative tricarboxylic transport membrane protein